MQSDSSTDPVIQSIRCWVENSVIGQGFCPFARKEFISDRIRYAICRTNDAQHALTQLIEECHYLDHHPDTETTLIIFSTYQFQFDHFLDFHALAEMLMAEQGYEGIYQVVPFHPNFVFAETHPDSAENYTNRSPCPVLHLLREESIFNARQTYPNIEHIPEKNIEYAKKLGVTTLKQQLLSCSKLIKSSNTNNGGKGIS